VLPSAPRTVRARVRQELTAEILAVARRHVAEQGAAALSLRSVARDLGMAPSALYRYFDGRDALLSALILSAYGALAETAEVAADVAHLSEASDAERWQIVPRALRAWALDHPHEWGLVFGSPVPGYHAPEDTVGPYARIAMALLRPVVEARDAGRLRSPERTRAVPDALRDAVAPVRGALLPDLPAETVVAALEAWVMIIGAISLEVFGHWRNTVLDPGLFFEATTRDVASWVGLT
jgi:AcrR family transcriptional regulator